MSRFLFLTVCPLLLTLTLPLDAAEGPKKDWKTVPLKELGLEPFKPVKDAKTGFIVGGKNPTELIRKLPSLKGRSIKDLENDMRPGGFSTKGFLGKKESLLEILAEDNEYVLNKLKTTHQELARHLLVLGKIAAKEKGEILYHGRPFKLTHVVFRGFANSPFEDGTKTNEEIEVQNVATGKKLRYSMLVPMMVERYGFYEGKGTPYRVDPRQVVEVLDFLKK